MNKMKVYTECAPCFLRQAKEALDLATDDKELKLEIMAQITSILGIQFQKGAVANKIGTRIHRTIKKETANQDPYHKEREKSNDIAMKFLPKVEAILKKDPRLINYIKASITGNILDFGALGLDIDIEQLFLSSLKKDLALDDSKKLELELKEGIKVLFLADNVGEIVFDKLLIQKINEYGVNVTVALKKMPILNDACLVEAEEVGMQQIADLTTTGTDSVGVIQEDLSPEFLDLFYESDLIIAKGLGNYEGLTEMELRNKPVFCLLNAKCAPIAKDIGVQKGDNLVIQIS
jgi:uncharacterized protein with ATP-grasp and redox domains